LSSANGGDIVGIEEECIIDSAGVGKVVPVDSDIVGHVSNADGNLVLDPGHGLLINEAGFEDSSEVDVGTIGSLGDNVSSKCLDKGQVSILVVFLGQFVDFHHEHGMESLKTGPEHDFEFGPCHGILSERIDGVVSEGIDLSLGVAEGELEIESFVADSSGYTPSGDVLVVIRLERIHDHESVILIELWGGISKCGVREQISGSSDVDGIVLIKGKLVSWESNGFRYNVVT